MPKVDVSFDGTNVTLPSDADVSVSPGNSVINFNLAGSAPAGAKVVGVEFAKPVEPTGTFAPDKVFGNQHTITKDSITHTLFGTTVGKNLNLADNDNLTSDDAEQDYAYKVWVEYNNSYYSSPDPVIKNDPPPKQGG